MFYTGVWSKSHINKKTICEEQYDVFKFFNCFKSLHFRYSIERFRLKYKLDLCTMVDKLVKKKIFFFETLSHAPNRAQSFYCDWKIFITELSWRRDVVLLVYSRALHFRKTHSWVTVCFVKKERGQAFTYPEPRGARRATHTLAPGLRQQRGV